MSTLAMMSLVPGGHPEDKERAVEETMLLFMKLKEKDKRLYRCRVATP
jgi:hypothetical protein